MARYLAEPDTVDLEFGEVMQAMSDEVRLRMLAALADGAYHSCNEEAMRLDLHKSTLSHHRRILREAGVTRTRLDGRNYLMCLRREDLDARFPGLLDAVLAGAAGAFGRVGTGEAVDAAPADRPTPER